MTVLIDTSAYYAVMAETDTSHIRAQRIYEALLGEGHELVTVSYVVLETAALLQRRHGLSPALKFRRAVHSRMHVIWVDQALHEAAWDELERLGRRNVSLVDCSLAVAGREAGIEHVFAFDPHMELLGLTPVTPELLG